MVLGGAMACGEEAPLSRVREDFNVVPGEPAVDWANPGVEVGPGADPDGWGLARVRHCDRFRQSPHRRVDILWVIDGSPSMAAKKPKLAKAMRGYLQGLLDASPALDFQLGVTSGAPDADGLLRPFPGGHRWLACGPGANDSRRCNVGSREAALAAVEAAIEGGTSGEVGSKGLLAAALAVDGRNRDFVREDAAVQVVFVAAEDDTSCGSFVEAPTCVASGFCQCDDASTWGSLAHHSRFFLGLKGYGNESAVEIGALVAAAENVLDFDDGSGRIYVGCTDDTRRPCAVGGLEGASCAFRAPRYLQLAATTGGITGDICAPVYDLAPFGQAARGLEREFRLSRVPLPGTIDVVVVPDDEVIGKENLCNNADACSVPYESCVRQKCARRWKEGLPEGWDPVISSDATERTAIRFGGTRIPEPLHTIEVCYDVDVRG